MVFVRKTYQQPQYQQRYSQPTHSNPEELLSVKSWNKFDKTFMAFGSVCNAMQKATREDLEWAWQFAKEKVNSLVEEVYNKDQPF